MTDIFISYSRDDRAIVSKMAASLAGEGFNVWWDPEIPPGSTFSDVIDARLKEADCVLVVWSASSIKSNWVQEEADDGLQNGRLIPVIIDPIELPRGFKRVQTADLTQWNGETNSPEWRRVVSEVKRLVSPSQKSGNKKPAKLAHASPPPSTTRVESPAGPEHSGKKKSGAGAAFGLLAALLLLGGGGYFAYTNDQARSALSSVSGKITDSVPQVSAPKPGSALKDCELCPEMVVIGPGEFNLGAPEGEQSSENSERPIIPVEVGYSFAIGKTEVTFDQWAACHDAGACGDKPNDQGWGEGTRPVVNVTVKKAQEYLDWLSAETGEVYRLPTEAEWEFAARGGTTTPFSIGEQISTKSANFNGQYPYGDTPKERSVGKSLPVASFEANPFGLYDVHGNVWEMTMDCWSPNHGNNPANGTAVETQGCSKRVLKGGAWNGGAWRTRSAHRKPVGLTEGDYDLGFRVVREL
ncbi:MAG: SUMF1/EgtB/PvdO family nonheme iron enzyme [Pseudomonadota bacterium]